MDTSKKLLNCTNGLRRLQRELPTNFFVLMDSRILSLLLSGPPQVHIRTISISLIYLGVRRLGRCYFSVSGRENKKLPYSILESVQNCFTKNYNIHTTRIKFIHCISG